MIAINDLTLSNLEMASVAGGWIKLPHYKPHYKPYYRPYPVALSKEFTFARERSNSLSITKASTDNVFVNKKLTFIAG